MSARKILNVEFNQNGTCFSISTESGFAIYTANPFQKKSQRTTNGGIEHTAMYGRTNILGLLGGGKYPAYGQTKIILWDDHQQKQLTQFNFLNYVNSLALIDKYIIISIEKKIFLFDFKTHDHITTLETGPNPKGLFTMNATGEYLAFPGVTVGEICLFNSTTNETSKIQAHTSEIACMTLSNDGTLLASASQKGTLIRLFSTADGKLLKELRRGSGEAMIYSLSFNKTNQYIACSSDRNTIHVFVTGQQATNEGEKEVPKNNTSMFGKFLGRASSYFSSEWSSGQVKINEPNTVCKFGEDEMLYAVSSVGNFYKIEIEHGTGNTKIIEKKNLFEE